MKGNLALRDYTGAVLGTRHAVPEACGAVRGPSENENCWSGATTLRRGFYDPSVFFDTRLSKTNSTTLLVVRVVDVRGAEGVCQIGVSAGFL